MSSKIAFCLAVFFAALFFVAPYGVAEPNMQEGKWEISGEMRLEGVPVPMPLVPVKFTQCLTKKDLVPYEKGKYQDCKMIDNKIEGNVVSWVMECKDKNGVTESTGRVTYKGNTFSGAAHNVSTDAKKRKTASTLQMSGKRIGDCE